MNLTGTWKGKYIYGQGYSAGIIGSSGPFQFEILDNDGIFTGTCIDDIVKKTNGNESFIEGVFKDSYISFLKSYKYHTYTGEPKIDGPFTLVKAEGVQYTGQLLKTFFTGKDYFEGEWSITSSFREKATGRLIYETGYGTWTMRKT